MIKIDKNWLKIDIYIYIDVRSIDKNYMYRIW